MAGKLDSQMRNLDAGAYGGLGFKDLGLGFREQDLGVRG